MLWCKYSTSRLNNFCYLSLILQDVACCSSHHIYSTGSHRFHALLCDMYIPDMSCHDLVKVIESINSYPLAVLLRLCSGFPYLVNIHLSSSQSLYPTCRPHNISCQQKSPCLSDVFKICDNS